MSTEIDSAYVHTWRIRNIWKWQGSARMRCGSQHKWSLGIFTKDTLYGRYIQTVPQRLD